MNSTMTDTAADEVFEITDKNYQRIAENVEKEGYREGINDGRDSVFQESFDNGYADGFRIGFQMGKAQMEKAGRGNCGLCVNSSLLSQPETEIRELHRKEFEKSSS